MSHTLYRKYRPQQFADIHGQVGIITTLKNQLVSGRTAHAYLFAGTRGTCKTTTARVLAKAVNCHTRAAGMFEPCGQCPSCTDITAGRSIDVIELDAATHTGVDTVREEIIENSRVLPTRDRCKIFIIDEVHMLSTSSFNALLKSLEEPPAHVIYILATTELHKIPATVASRCQRFIFQPLALSVMQEKLRAIAAAENVTVADSVVQKILAVSGGAMRDAESLLGQLLALHADTITDEVAAALLPPSSFSETIEFINRLHASDAVACFTLVAELFESGTDLVAFHDALLRRAHELMVCGATGVVPRYLGIFSDDETQQLLGATRALPAAWLGRLIAQLVEKRSLYKTIASPFLPLHLVIATTIEAAPAQRPPETKQQTPTPVAPPPRVEPNSVTTISREIIERFWPQAVQAIVTEQPSLGIVLAATAITDVRDNQIVLSVRFPIHLQRLIDLKLKTRIEARLSELCGATVTYVAEYDPDLMSHDPNVAAALDTFGGRVVA